MDSFVGRRRCYGAVWIGSTSASESYSDPAGDSGLLHQRVRGVREWFWLKPSECRGRLYPRKVLRDQPESHDSGNGDHVRTRNLLNEHRVLVLEWSHASGFGNRFHHY